VTDEEKAIASLSDAELETWHALFGFDRLSRQQAAQVLALLAGAKREAGPAPRHLSPNEWAAVFAEPVETAVRRRARLRHEAVTSAAATDAA
jgi:hypothetical protein